MPITGWDDSLALGIPELDQQHKVLIDYLNELYDAADREDRDAVACELHDKLRLYAQEHFSREEALMAERGAPNAAAHQAEHRFFTGKVASLDKACATSREAYESTLNFLARWFIDHIRGTDQTLRSDSAR